MGGWAKAMPRPFILEKAFNHEEHEENQ